MDPAIPYTALLIGLLFLITIGGMAGFLAQLDAQRPEKPGVGLARACGWIAAVILTCCNSVLLIVSF